ncbi:MAG: hypothetical protein ACRD2L_21510, partial [Terriglobia bacterium]
VESLRRIGVVFNQEQKETIKNLAETGRTLEAQDAILKKVRDSVGGAGAGQAQGLAGAFDDLSDAVRRFWEEVYTGTAAGNELAAVLKRIAEANKAATEVIARSTADNLALRLQNLNEQIKTQQSKMEEALREGTLRSGFWYKAQEGLLAELLRQQGELQLAHAYELRVQKKKEQDEQEIADRGAAEQRAAMEQERLKKRYEMLFQMSQEELALQDMTSRQGVMITITAQETKLREIQKSLDAVRLYTGKAVVDEKDQLTEVLKTRLELTKLYDTLYQLDYKNFKETQEKKTRDALAAAQYDQDAQREITRAANEEAKKFLLAQEAKYQGMDRAGQAALARIKD